MNWRDFLKLRPVLLDTVNEQVVWDVLVTDFGMRDDFQMEARESLLMKRSSSANQALRLHPDACRSLIDFCGKEAATEAVTAQGAIRMKRLGIRLIDALASLWQHPWYNGRALGGGITDVLPLPAWTAGGLVYPERMSPDCTPVILLPKAEKAVGYLNICTFRMEEVECPIPTP